MKTQQKMKSTRRGNSSQRNQPKVPFAVMVRRATLAGGIVLLASTTLSGPASAIAISWNSTSGSWNSAGNWSPAQLPAAADAVTIDVAGSQTITHDTGTTNITSLNNAETLIINNGSQLNVNGGTSSNSGTIQAGGASGGTLTLNSVTLTNTGGSLTAANGGVISQNSSTIVGGTIGTSGTGAFRPTNTSNNRLQNVTVSGTLDLASATAQAFVQGGALTLNGTVNVNNNSVFGFFDTNAVSGTGAIVLGDTGGANRINLEGNGTTTLGAGITIRGQNGTIGGQSVVGGTQTIINNGKISADVSGGTITITDSAVTNNGTLEAKNGGTLELNSPVTGGTIFADTGSVVRLSSSSVTGSTINTAGTGVFRPTNTSANVLSGATVNGTVDMATGTSTLQVVGGLTHNGTINVNNNSVLAFNGDNTVSGTGSIVLGNTGGSNRITLEGAGTTTIGSTVTIRGQNGTIGGQAIVGGTQVLVNNGKISADVAGGSIDIQDSAVTNNGILEAKNGGTLVLSSNVNGSATGQIVAGAGSTVVQNSVTISGTVNASGTGNLRPTNSSANRLDNVTFNGTLDLASATAQEFVQGGALTLNGTVNLNNNSIFGVFGTTSLSGTGTIVLGDTGGSNRITLEGDGTTTLGSGMTIRGQNGTIGGQVNTGGTQLLVNNGKISADVAGGTIDIQDSAVTNNGILEAKNGGKLVLSSNVTGGATGQIVAGAGSTVIQNSTVISGNVQVVGGGSFRPTNTSNNRLDNVTFTGTLDMANTTAQEFVQGGSLVLNGTVNINSNSILGFIGSNVVSGTGTIVLGDTGGSNRITLEGDGTTTTIGTGIVIRGQNGTIGNPVLVGGASTLLNKGKISADVAAGTISIQDSAVTNEGVLEARNGGTLVLNSPVSGGTINADTNGVVLLSSSSVTGSTITTAGGGVFRPTNTSANVLSGGIVNGTVDMASFTGQMQVTNDLTLNGAININSNSILEFNGTNTVGGTGTIVLGDTGGANRITLEGNGTTTIGAGVTLRGQNGTVGNNVLVGGTQTLVNNGTISADVSAGTIAFQDSAISNFGTFQAKNGGQLLVQSGVAFTNQTGGLVEAKAGSAVVFQNGSNVTNLTGGTLAGGIWRSDSTGVGGAATIDFQSPNTAIATNNADIYLVGANSVFQARNAGFAVTTLDSSLFTNNVALRIQEGRSFTATANGGNFINNGLLELASGTATSTFKANTSLTNSATAAIVGYGVVDNRVANSGLIAAQLGTLTVNGGMTGNGTARATGAAATLDLSPATAGSTAATLELVGGGKLNLGSQNFTVSKDYTNSAFGVGNAFDARANVSGAGQIIGQNTQQAITGDVTGGTTPTVTLNLGNIRGGTSVTKNYQVANTGSAGAADLRGAVQTSFAGGGVTDGRLSGTGVTAQNFGPIAAGANTGNLAVTFNAISGGALTGQSIKIANNFDNVAEQTISLTGTATTLATGTATPSGTVNLGAYRVGSPLPAAMPVSVANNATGVGAERLGISSVGTTGNFSATNVLGAGLINPGAASAGAVTAQMSSGIAGANNGSVTINYRSDGTAIDPTFTSVASNSQTINFTSTGYNVAQATLGSLNFGTVAVGTGPTTRFLTVTNSALAGLFSEDLKAQLGAITGTTASQFSTAGSGVINNLIAGASDSTTLKVTLTPTAAGAISAQVAVELFSTGTVGGVANGLGQLRLADGSVPLLGTIDSVGLAFNLAAGSATPTSKSFGNVRVGDAAAQAITVSNVAPVDPLTEGLNASVNPLSGTGVIAAGSVSNLAAGASNASGLLVGIDTSTAGAKSGTARVTFVSDGSINAGGATTPVGSQDIGVSGNVFRLAQASVTPDPVVVAAQRVGGTNSAAVTIANTAAADGFSEGLRASGNGSTGAATLSGPASILLAAGTNSTAYGVSVDTATAGAKSGAVAFSLASDGTGTSGIAGNVALAGKTLNVQGKVYAQATTDTSTQSVNFGTVRRGTVLGAQSVTVTNTASAQALNDKLVLTGISGAAAPFGVTAGAGLLAGVDPGSSGSISATLSTTTAGVFTTSALASLVSRNPDMSDLSLGTKQIDLSGTINEIAAIDFSKAGGGGSFTGAASSFTLDLGDIVQGTDFAATQLRLANAVSALLPADTLIGSFDVSGAVGPFQLTGFGAVPELSATTVFDSLVDIDTSTLGSYLGTILFNGASHNGVQSDLALAPVSISLRARIVSDVPPPPPPPPPTDVPEPASGAALGLGAGLLYWMRRRRAAASAA